MLKIMAFTDLSSIPFIFCRKPTFMSMWCNAKLSNSATLLWTYGGGNTLYDICKNFN